MTSAPSFWAKDGVLPRLLSPLGGVYAGLGWLRWALNPRQSVGVPVLCVGNATVGGTGKTPIVLDLLGRLQAAGVEVHALGRGHGGQLAGPLRVDPDRHHAGDVGDEALLHAEMAPTWIARDRLNGAKAAVASGARFIVLDDGLQYPKLEKTEAWLLIDSETGVGNGRCVPAGPLREPLSRAAKNATRAVAVGAERERPAIVVNLGAALLAPLACRFVPSSNANALEGVRCLAFAGIGRPEKFFRALEEVGAQMVERRSFADHHPYSDAEIASILNAAERSDLVPVTTTKDRVRLKPADRAKVRTLEIAVEWQDEAALQTVLAPLIETSLQPLSTNAQRGVTK